MVKVEFTDGRIEEISPASVKDILKKLNLKETTTLVTRDGELLTHDIHVYDGQDIKIINVVSGG
ncbi:MoaD/ThiS family protein [Geovibrio thiophilus]|uniref:MoaD/ThiS family protein n=1 Tax=Geovibrio thiophilus TaxID=139438 RepID=A0A3R5UVP4_9BACT|nr:MoaD/ThiS family protein [Geovibrio thiophilus]QAR33843.1 MoaD/ThiS family protein [Geovibrio thiophilus]